MKRISRMGGAVLMLALVVGACGRPQPGPGDLVGTITGDGSSTVFPITEAVAEEFRRDNRFVQVLVGVSGTGGGFSKFCNGETDLQNASRPIKEEEVEACRRNGIGYHEMRVANDGLAVLVNPSNTWASCLTTDELRRIWEPRSPISAWNEIRPEFPDVRLRLFGPGTDSGTFDYFTDAIVGEEGASRTDYTASEDDNVLVQGVAGERGALGYFGFAYYEENQDKLKLLGVDAGDGCRTPSVESVQSNTYAPLSRPLYLYVRHDSLRREEMRAFMDFYLDNVSLLVRDVGYIPLREDVLADERKQYESTLEAVK